MGVDCRFYVVNGIKVPYDINLANDLYEHLEYADGESQIDFVVDQMMGKYIVLGDIICHLDDEGYTEFKTIDRFMEGALAYKKRFIETFPQHKELMEQYFEVIAFNHYY